MICFTSLPSPEIKFIQTLVKIVSPFLIFFKNSDFFSEMTLFGNSGSSFGSSNTNNTKEHTVQEVPADTVSRLQFTGANSQNGQVVLYICIIS